MYVATRLGSSQILSVSSGILFLCRALLCRSRQRFDNGLKRLEHADKRLSGAAIAVSHERPDCARARIVLDVGRVTRFRARVPERNHSMAGQVTDRKSVV